jgi:hypothetical protein
MYLCDNAFFVAGVLPVVLNAKVTHSFVKMKNCKCFFEKTRKMFYNLAL